MTFKRLALKTLTVSLLITVDLMAGHFQKYYDQTGFGYFQRDSTHKVVQPEKRKTIYRDYSKKYQQFAKINAKFAQKIYEELKNIEANLEYPVTEDVLQYNKMLIRQVNSGQKIQRQFRGLTFKDITFDQSVGNMISIIQTKLNCIGDIYQPQRIDSIDNSEDEEAADPYYANICMDYNKKIYYHFTLNYSGQSKFAKQPGNCLIRRSIKWGNHDRTAYSINYSSDDYFNYLQMDEDLKDLLMSLEVARRKVTDKDIDLQDIYYDLPIYSASIMAIQLMNDSKISEPDFWIKGSKYHMYSGERIDREAGIKNIIKKYTETYKIYNLKQLDKLFE